MLSSTVVAIALVAAAGPALAAPAPVAQSTVPVSGAFDTKLIGDAVKIGDGVIDGINGLINGAGSIKDLINGNSKRQVAASGALDTDFIGDVVDIGDGVIDGINGIINGVGSIKNLVQGKSSKRDTAASVPMQLTPSQALNLGSIFSTIINGIGSLFGGGSNQKREEIMMLARQAQAGDQSAALNLGKVFGSIIDGITGLFGGDQNQQQSSKREIVDVLARMDPASAASAALSLGALGNIFKIGGEVFNGAQDLFGGDDSSQQQKREMVEHFVRGAATVNPQALSAAISLGSLGNIAKFGGDIFSGLEDVFGGDNDQQQSSKRAVPTAAAQVNWPTTPSGAIDFGSILSTVASFIPAFLKREDMELLARDLAYTTDASGAIDFGSILSSIGSFLFGKREMMEILARDVAYTTDASGAIDFGSILSSIGSFLFGKREDMELLAREPFVVLPGQTPPKLPNFSNLGIHPVFLRSLNELD